ncbi:hypothetical protein PPERSA_12130 [Pseudocohnilembus persalinus]|uniref:Uncharacterized protein n=1 Tax=Pseudocohnilembus persalinus TaxID=266149 RepID=A0A0V0QPJ2_PSEPJ|nr:hypothetical protein PPERSA_12130 [Pseudocohnilembus persalinus]|eukprot:KRX03925.1 hypothetical protein PPERSA_12130 [Pseudocohnilembus persalinus]
MSEDKQLKLNKFEQDNTIAQPYLKFLAQSHNSQFNNIYNNNNLNMNNSSNQNNQNESYSSESSKNINLQTKPFSGIHQMQQIYKNQQKVMKKIMPNNTSQSDSMSQKKKRTSYKAELDTNSRPREKRVKERTILYVLKKVVKWRKVYDKSVKGQDTSNMNVEQYRTANLKQAAEYVQLSRKTLDDYFSMIRRGYNYNFDFRNKYKEKMGVLRQHIKEIENNGGKMKSKGVDVFKIWDMVTEGRSIDINDFEEDELDDDSYEYEDECEDGYQETENAESNLNTETSDIGKKKMKMNNQDEQYIGNNRYEILQNLDMSKSQLNQSFNKSSCQNNLTSQSQNEKQNGATENNNNNNTSSMESESSEQQKVLINPAFNQVFKEKYSQKNQQDNKSQQQNNRLLDIQVNQSQSLDGPLILQNKKNSESISMQTNA